MPRITVRINEKGLHEPAWVRAPQRLRQSDIDRFKTVRDIPPSQR